MEGRKGGREGGRKEGRKEGRKRGGWGAEGGEGESSVVS